MRQYLCDLIWGFTPEIEGEDPNNYTGFLLIHDKLAINILISVGLDQFGNALSKSLSDTPGNADGLCLLYTSDAADESRV